MADDYTYNDDIPMPPHGYEVRIRHGREAGLSATEDITATEVARRCFYAMLAIGFGQESVVEAFEAIAADYRTLLNQ